MLAVLFLCIFVLHQVQTLNVCDSDFCVCRFKNNLEIPGEFVDCSYNPRILKDDYILPPAPYSLDLSRNNLTGVLPSSLLKSDSLIELLLNNNKIVNISADALQLKSLKILDLSDNELEFIDKETFQYIIKLEYLNVANNRFTTFSQLTFHHLSDLKEIVLDNNELGPSLEDMNLFDRSGYGLTRKIQSLSIGGINLNNVHDNFFVDAYDLRKLVISNNNLKDVFELPFTLEYLDLSDNPINEISGEDFAEVPGLKWLKLNNLNITEIPAYTFSSLHGLIDLELERNKNLTRFSVDAFGHEVLEDADDFTLEKFSVKGSRLTTLNEKLVTPLGQLMKLDLQGNMWQCDCKIVWLKKLQIHAKEYDHLRCFTPRSLYNSRIFELDTKYFKCSSNQRHVGSIIGVVTLCVLLSSLALWIFLFLPRNQSRCNFVSNIYPSTGYAVLPININTSDR